MGSNLNVGPETTVSSEDALLPKSVIDRALLVLSTFQNQQEGLTLSDISRRTGLPVATCYRILQQFARWGALDKDADGLYSIGLRLWEVASHAPNPTNLQRIARPHMQDLYEATGFPTHLAIRDGLELVTIERFQHGQRPIRRPVVGGRYPMMHASAVGLVLLAYAPAHIREQVLSQPLQRFTSRTPTQRTEVEAILQHVVRAGYAVSDRQANDQMRAVAAPVLGRGSIPVAALSVAWVDGRVDENTQADLVIMTAARISKGLRAARDTSALAENEAARRRL